MPTPIKGPGYTIVNSIPEFRQRARAATDLSVEQLAVMTQAEAKRLLNQKQSPPPSEPGQPPHKATGTLARSIVVQKTKTAFVITTRVISRVRYGLFLEIGTRTIAPRPYLRPAWDKVRESALGLFRKEFGRI